MPAPATIVDELAELLERQGWTPYEAARHAAKLAGFWREGMEVADLLAYAIRTRQFEPEPRRPAARRGPANDGAAFVERARRSSRTSTDQGPSRRSRRERDIHQRTIDLLLQGLDEAGLYPDGFARPGEPATFARERFPVDQPGRRRVTVTDEDRYLHGNVPAGTRVYERTGVGRVTPRGAIASLFSMDEDDLRRLQAQLNDAGFYGDSRPAWGIPTKDDVDAYLAFFDFLASQPGLTVKEGMRLAQERAIGMRGANPEGAEGADETGGAPLFVAEVMDPDSLRQLADALGQRLFGRDLDPAVREQIIQDFTDADVAAQRRRFEADNADRLGGSGREPGDPPEDQLRRFMRALSGQESGGDPTAVNGRTGAYGTFQIMPQNWPTWARRAGVDPRDRSAAAQERVARRIISDYYQQFGNWRDVAIAWYAGPGAAANPGSRDRNRRQGAGNEPSINQYADTVMARMERLGLEDPAAPGGYETFMAVTEDPEASLEAELRRRDPAGYTATRFADQAREFFGMLGGVA